MKAKIIFWGIFITIIAVLILGGYFFIFGTSKNPSDNLPFLAAGISESPLKIDNKTEQSSVSFFQENPPLVLKKDTNQTTEILEGIGRSGLVAPLSHVETISDQKSMESTTTEPFLIEELNSLKIPSLIYEKKFNLLAPLATEARITPEQNFLAAVGGGPDEEEEILNQQNSTSTPEIATSTPLQFSFYIPDYKITSRHLTLNWHSSSTGVILYDGQYKIGSSSESLWQDLFAVTSSSSFIFEVPQDLITYYFRGRATSQIGTSTMVGDWQEIETPINFYPVVINEIAWAGTATSSADEWIELFNKADQTIDLASLTLKSATNKDPEIILKGSIGPKEYFLLERTNDHTVNDIVADQIYTGALNNSPGEILELRDKFGNLLDKTVLLLNGEWPAGTKSPDFRTMERVNPYLPADIPGNWLSNSPNTHNGLDAGGQPINGTPKAQNSVFDPGLFYLYPATSTNATSTVLAWTKSFLPDFKEYKILRSSTSSFDAASTTMVASVRALNFLDATLESETKYYYKILACDNGVSCAESNDISVKTPEFLFVWSESQMIFEIATSSNLALLDIAFDSSNQPFIVWLNATSTATSSEIIVLNNKNRPYKFWVSGAPRDEIYFTYQMENLDWRPDKKIIRLPYEVKMLKGIIDSANTAYLAWIGGQDEIKLYYSYSQIE